MINIDFIDARIDQKSTNPYFHDKRIRQHLIEGGLVRMLLVEIKQQTNTFVFLFGVNRSIKEEVFCRKRRMKLFSLNELDQNI